MRVIVHGGADSPPEHPESRRAVLDRAADRGAAESIPTDAVCSAIGVLESDPQFNAGVGAAIQADGYARTDAGLMTDDLEVGAACAMPGVEHAVEVARIVNTETPHVLVAGVHAVDLAESFGVETGVNLDTPAARERFETERSRVPIPADVRAQAKWVNDRFGDETESETDSVPPGTDHDTVGAVATDGKSIAAATSSGGRWFALAGRVGDVSQVGSGFYCTPAGGASATGAGEDIARVTLSRRAVQLLETGIDATTAAETAIEEFADLTGSRAGIILLTQSGDVGSAFNSPAMATSVAGAVD